MYVGKEFPLGKFIGTQIKVTRTIKGNKLIQMLLKKRHLLRHEEGIQNIVIGLDHLYGFWFLHFREGLKQF
jgi:thiamine pyrophosphokinase